MPRAAVLQFICILNWPASTHSHTNQRVAKTNSAKLVALIFWTNSEHYNDIIMGTMASQISSLTIVYSTIYSGADQRKHQSSASLAFVRGIHWSPVNSPHKWPVTRNMFPFDDVIMCPSKPSGCNHTINREFSRVPSQALLKCLGFNSLALGRCGSNLRMETKFWNSILQIDMMSISWEIALMCLPQNTFAIRHQAITWANVDVDLCHHKVSPGYN